MVLVDASVWIEVFRRPPRLRLEDAVEFKQIVTALPIVQEVLQGFKDERAFGLARDALFRLPVLEPAMGPDLFLEAVGLYRSARRAGMTVRSGIDCLIAACALRHGATMLHHDRDFDKLARVSSLDARDLRLRAT